MHIIISDCIVQSSTAPPNDTAIPAASRRGNPSCSSQPPSSARRIGPMLTSIAAVPALPPHRIDYENGLQSFGDWVLAALEQHADGAAEAARCTITALRERDWEGDDVLVDQVWPALAVDYAREIGQEDEDESDDPDKCLWARRAHCLG